MLTTTSRSLTRPALCLILLASHAAGAMASDDYRFKFVTPVGLGVAMLEPSLSADGRVIAFRTTANLTGQNADRSSEVFVYFRDTNELKQVTSAPNNASTACSVPMILPDASKVCFLSAWDFTFNQAGSTFQIWEVDISTGAYRKVTGNPFGTPVQNPRMSGDGNYFTFSSHWNFNNQNPGNSQEVFRINRLTGATIQLSNNASQPAQFPDINYDGSIVVWGDPANYDGSNANASFEIWKWTLGAPVPIVALTNQANGTQETNFPKIDDAGRFVCFMSYYDFSGGGGTGRKVFLADTLNNTITRITSTGVGGPGTAEYPDPEMAPDGSAVYFESDINLEGQNLDANRELWRYDIAAASLKALTKTTNGTPIVQLSDEATRRYIEIAHDGNTIAYRSDRALDPAMQTPSNTLDLYVGNAPVCPADVLVDGVLDLSDYFQFFNYFDQTDPGADIDGIPGVDLGDFFHFFNYFDSGCN